MGIRGSGGERRSVTVRVARWSALHPWRAIVGWFVFVALCLVAGSAAGMNSAASEDFRVGEAGRAEAMASEGDLQIKSLEQILISGRAGKPDEAAADAAVRDVTRRMKQLPEVDEVGAPVRSANGEVIRVPVTLNGPEQEAREIVVPLQELTEKIKKAHPGVVIEETGAASVSKGVDDQRDEDLAFSEAITLPITLITLALVFGSLLMVGVPLLLAVTSIAATMGLAMLASHLLPDTGVGLSMILLIGMAVGVDYTLFYLKREREERARAGGRLSSEALVEAAAATAGRAIVVSGLAVIVSTAALFLADDVIFDSLATGTILVVAVAVASSVSVLPAMLVKLGQRAERRAARRRAEGKRVRLHEERTPGRFWNALLAPARKRPALTLGLAVLALVGLALPALDLKLKDPARDSFSREIPAMQGYDRLLAAFPDERLRFQVVARSAPERSDDVVRALRALDREAAADPLFARHDTPRIRTSADGRISTLDLGARHATYADEAVRTLDHLRDDYLPATVGKLHGVETAVSGDVPRGVDYVAHQNEKLPLVLGALLLLTFAMTVYAFRSVVLGLLGIVLNLLSAASALGLLVLVFQGEWAEGLLSFESLHGISSRVPLFLFVILFGLSMDYQVFVVSRIREAALNGVPTRKAVIDGIASSAKVVTSAAIVMVTVFASFVMLHILEMKQMGFVLAVAVLVDAFVIRVMILPAALLLLGRATWWPSKAVRRAEERLTRGYVPQPAPGAEPLVTGVGTTPGR
ncbi:MMPL family transporter [Streptomyces sp. AN091965]|uniref:MMPL family transporter n=1 Tax=Streptomyces sp. AN091965 TaxID=2927803 RepID=UPI001F6249A8|nr:MMPL family transporter [Streptomyces sp. AN091965]MCI3933573.1 MMPL family transporter [Streptomyces sp. AN091965]